MTLQSGPAAIELRPAEADDLPFLFTLYMAHHQGEFAALPVSQRELLLDVQFRARQRGYTQAFPDSRDQIVLREREPIGRLWMAELAYEHRVVDIALLPDYCGTGIGTRLLTAEIGRASAAGKPLRLTVDRANTRARQLYHRLGFSVIDGGPVHLTLSVP